MNIESLIWQAAYQKRLHRTAQERGSKVMDSAYISALAALAGSSIGGLATFATTWLNQSYQHKIQRHSNERARREKLFGDFMHEAASAYSDAMVNKLENSTGLVNLYSLKSRMSLFSGEDVLQEADKVLQIIIDRYFVDEIKYSNMSPSAVKEFDLLRDFTRACKKEITRLQNGAESW